MDIYILVESVDNVEHIEKLRQANEDYKKSLLAKYKKPAIKPVANLATTPKLSGKEPLKFDEIKDSLNGFARIISY